MLYEYWNLFLGIIIGYLVVRNYFLRKELKQYKDVKDGIDSIQAEIDARWNRPGHWENEGK